MTNTYSRRWFDTFLETMPSHVTDAEVAFVERVLPLPAYRRLLDLCCGSGRHAEPLSRLGYLITGVDRDPECLRHAKARLSGTQARFIQADMRDLSSVPGPFDAAMIMWQSFGYFDAGTNRDVLAQIADRLRPGGRLLLDLYHRAFFEARPGTITHERDGRHIEETKWMGGNRLSVRLDYGGGEEEQMEWQLFYPEEIAAFAAGVGLQEVLACSRWQEITPPSPDVPRMQIVLEKG